MKNELCSGTQSGGEESYATTDFGVWRRSECTRSSNTTPSSSHLIVHRPLKRVYRIGKAYWRVSNRTHEGLLLTLTNWRCKISFLTRLRCRPQCIEVVHFNSIGTDANRIEPAGCTHQAPLMDQVTANPLQAISNHELSQWFWMVVHFSQGLIYLKANWNGSLRCLKKPALS